MDSRGSEKKNRILVIGGSNGATFDIITNLVAEETTEYLIHIDETRINNKQLEESPFSLKSLHIFNISKIRSMVDDNISKIRSMIKDGVKYFFLSTDLDNLQVGRITLEPYMKLVDTIIVIEGETPYKMRFNTSSDYFLETNRELLKKSNINYNVTKAIRYHLLNIADTDNPKCNVVYVTNFTNCKEKLLYTKLIPKNNESDYWYTKVSIVEHGDLIGSYHGCMYDFIKNRMLGKKIQTEDIEDISISLLSDLMVRILESIQDQGNTHKNIIINTRFTPLSPLSSISYILNGIKNTCKLLQGTLIESRYREENLEQVILHILNSNENLKKAVLNSDEY